MLGRYPQRTEAVLAEHAETIGKNKRRWNMFVKGEPA